MSDVAPSDYVGFFNRTFPLPQLPQLAAYAERLHEEIAAYDLGVGPMPALPGDANDPWPFSLSMDLAIACLRQGNEELMNTIVSLPNTHPLYEDFVLKYNKQGNLKGKTVPAIRARIETYNNSVTYRDKAIRAVWKVLERAMELSIECGISF